MNAPSGSPRGEKASHPGVTWEAWVEWQGEHWEPDADTSSRSPISETAGPDANQLPPPIPNRATRRAIARAARRNR